MELKDIIGKPEDRVFVIAPECFIIFTGDSLDDERPLIRIGNSRDLPLEALPLIENIVVPDIPTGSPFVELNNIDHASPGKNRYIGSTRPVRDGLALLKAQGAETEAMTVMEIEQAGEKTEERAISKKGSYTGIFYRGGNFRVKRGDMILFDLTAMREKHCSDTVMCSLLSRESAEDRYRGKGFITLTGSPCIYGNGYFTLHGIYPSFFKDFHSLRMDPSLVQGVVMPGGPVSSIIPLLKWKHEEKRRLRIFSHDTDAAALLGRMYPDCVLTVSPLSGMEYSTGEGIVVSQIKNSTSLLAQYRNVPPARADVNIAFIADYEGIEGALHSRAHILVMNGTIYDGAAPLLKDVECPILVTGDGLKQGKIRPVVTLPARIQYEVRIYDDMDTVLKDLIQQIAGAGLGYLLEEWPPRNKRKFMKMLPRQEGGSLEEIISLQNLKTMFRIEEELHGDSVVRKIIDAMEKNLPEGPLMEMYPGRRRVDLAVYGDRVYFIHGADDRGAVPEYPFPDEITMTSCGRIAGTVFHEPCLTILQDRERLQKLLSLYYKKSPVLKKNLKQLAGAMPGERDISPEGAAAGDRRSISRQLRKIRLRKIRKILIIIAVPFILAGLFLAGMRLYHDYRAREEKMAVERKVEAEKNRVETIKKTYNVHVSDYDVFLYANQVALKNGYAPIELKNLKKKNPNWIFPGNVFILMDGERITVVEGNTLWGISEKKLMQRHIDFYSLIEEVKDMSANDPAADDKLKKAGSLAFSKSHFEILEKMKKRDKP